MGWFPLGWGEPYVPSYPVSREYFQQVNVSNTHITNITNVTNNYYVTNNNTTVVNNNIQNIHYANQNGHGAVTAVPTRTMTNSEPVAKVAVAVPASEVQAGAFTTAAPVAPARTSVLGANAGAHAPVPPQHAMARSVVSHVAPPPKPVPFEAKQEALAQDPGRPLDAQTEAQVRTNYMRSPQGMENRNVPAAGANQRDAGTTRRAGDGGPARQTGYARNHAADPTARSACGRECRGQQSGCRRVEDDTAPRLWDYARSARHAGPFGATSADPFDTTCVGEQTSAERSHSVERPHGSAATATGVVQLRVLQPRRNTARCSEHSGASGLGFEPGGASQPEKPHAHRGCRRNGDAFKPRGASEPENADASECGDPRERAVESEAAGRQCTTPDRNATAGANRAAIRAPVFGPCGTRASAQ